MNREEAKYILEQINESRNALSIAGDRLKELENKLEHPERWSE